MCLSLLEVSVPQSWNLPFTGFELAFLKVPCVDSLVLTIRLNSLVSPDKISKGNLIYIFIVSKKNFFQQSKKFFHYHFTIMEHFHSHGIFCNHGTFLQSRNFPCKQRLKNFIAKKV